MKKSMAVAVIAAVSLVSGAEKEHSPVVDLGGYGELHLNKVYPKVGDAAPAKLDFHRFVLMVGKQFNDQWSFGSEVELEHNIVEGGEESGALELEQAYIQFAPRQEFTTRAGVILQPMGLLNETHEPTRFSSVERPIYHNVIIPTTWFGAGAAVSGSILKNAVQYDVVVFEGLDDRKFDEAGKEGLRSARQEGLESKLDNILGTVRLDYTGVPGLIAGGSVAVNETGADNDPENRHKYSRAVISELHVQYNGNGFRSSVEFGNVGYTAIENRGGKLEQTQGVTAELGYNVARLWDAQELALYPYTRFTQLNRTGSIGDDGAYSRVDGGLALHPLKQLAIKVDAGTEFFKDDSKNKTYVNAGVGYEF